MEQKKNNFLPNYPQILQVSTRPWLYGLSQKYKKSIATINDIPEDELMDIKEKGFDIIWTMGIWALGSNGLKHDQTEPSRLKGYKEILPDFTIHDVIGSPYSIMEYTPNKQICPNEEKDLQSFREKLKKYNIKLMLDFVPNHSSIDSPWISANIDYYIRAPKSSNSSYDEKRYLPNGVAYAGIKNVVYWTDVAQLNYWNPETVRFMINKIKKIASLCDAIRCDVAQVIVNEEFENNWKEELFSWGWKKPTEEFWDVAIKEIKKEYPNFIFLAESYMDGHIELIKEGFDFCYDKTLLDKLAKNENCKEISKYINGNKKFNDHLCHFLENHDHNRAMALFKENSKQAKAAAVIVYTIPGMKFFFQDQSLGLKNRLEVQLRRSYKENKNEEIFSFYNQFFKIIQNDIFKYGKWKNVVLTGKNADNLLSWIWHNEKENKFFLVIVNYNQTENEGEISSSLFISGKELIDFFTKESITIKDNIISVHLKEYEFKILIN